MTKEEILTKIANDNSYSDWGEYMYDTHEHTQVEAACIAMDEYAKQKAIEFHEWILNSDYHYADDPQKLFDLFNTNKEV